jgi:tetratricopeptide (TPR) repeat protein
MFRAFLTALALLPAALNAQTTAQEHLASARSAYAIDSLGTALAHADSALVLDAAIAGGYKLRGDIKQKQRNLHGALIDYTKAERLDPEDARLYVSRSAVYITEGRLKEAVKDANMAIKLSPNDADAWYNRACANYLGRNNDGALKDLERAVDLNPELSNGLFLRGVVKGELYKEEDGLADIEAALRLDPTIAGGRMSAAVLLFETERYAEAIERFTEVIDANGEEVKEAHYYRADCYYHLNDKDRACADWRSSGELGDKDAQFIVRNYCNTDLDKIPRKPQKNRKTVIEF